MPDTGREAAANLIKVLRAARAGIPRDLTEVGVAMTNDMTVTLSQPGAGDLYTTRFYTTRRGRVVPYGTRVPHRASAPGQPPAVDTGRLRASYTYTVTRTPTGGTLVFGSGDKKAKMLEFGTRRMAARPHLRPVAARARGTTRDRVASGVTTRERAMAARLS